MSSEVLEWIKTIGSLVLSWPVAILVIALIFRKRLLNVFDRFIGSDEGLRLKLRRSRLSLANSLVKAKTPSII